MRTTHLFITSIIVLSSLILLNGCKKEENPVTPPSEHFEPEGWIIRDTTQRPVLVVWQGIVQRTWAGSTVRDTLDAPLNALSDYLTVKFLDADKKIMDPPSGSEHTFDWLISDISVLAIVQDKPGDWAFHLHGKKAGGAALELQVRHLGHVDMKTPKIPVAVR